MAKHHKLERNQNLAVAYIRVSPGDRQVNGQRVAAAEAVSLDLQEERVRAYCALRGFTLLAIFREEEVSAGKPLGSRPQGHSLLAALKESGTAHVITTKLDRMFRDSIDAQIQARQFAEQGIALHFLDLGGQAVDTTSAVGGLIFAVVAACAEMERRLVSERTKSALAFKRSQGVRLGAPALDTPDTIARVAFLRQRGLTLRQIVTALNSEGIETMKGGKWAPATVRKILVRQGIT